jgi:hypothetical protein
LHLCQLASEHAPSCCGRHFVVYVVFVRADMNRFRRGRGISSASSYRIDIDRIVIIRILFIDC